MAVILSSLQKRVRSDDHDEDEVSPTKRNKVFTAYSNESMLGDTNGLNEMMMIPDESQVQAQTLAQTFAQDEGMGMGMEMDDSMMDDDQDQTLTYQSNGSNGMGDASNPLHPWNAPRMLHQVSTNSLSSTASSAAPGTPLDLSHPFHPSQSHSQYPFQDTPSTYPTPHNPTSFTDHNGVTRSFPSTSPVSPPALSPYPPTNSPQFEREDPGAFAAYVAQNMAGLNRGTIQIVSPGEEKGMQWGMGMGEGVMERDMRERELELPKYNWDVDRPALGLGGHLV